MQVQKLHIHVKYRKVSECVLKQISSATNAVTLLYSYNQL